MPHMCALQKKVSSSFIFESWGNILLLSDTDDYARVALPTGEAGHEDNEVEDRHANDESDVESVIESEEPHPDGISIGFSELI